MKYALFLLLLITGFSEAQESLYNKTVKAEILMEDQGGFLNITGMASNLTDADQSIHYELAVIKKDTATNNNTKNNQTGRGVLKSKTQGVLSTTKVNLNIPDLLTIMLLIYDEDDKLIGKDLKRIEPNTIQLEKKPVTTYDGIEITGLVTRDIRTAPARRFYDYFYKEYKKYRLNGSKVVTINEQFGQGRFTRIEVLVGTEVIYQFFLNPNLDFIEQMGDYCIRLVYQKFQKDKLIQAQLNN
ncbi:CsgE family curli-type amyloid fiber assembly protein [Nonlabens agnitus]|uniref:Curli production assembly/transport component CsgE n=1 Tax=Nonlabens agnitus TaxID=870484 RepID=A0A2S9WSA8_9FLAO|nr:CsgE family curli-type amyloid fiber assembly protein [Nonlabens agnitus]PRP66176.1 hypothetical protein BST86_03255 [Nonlabens agnitus]